MSGPLDGVTIVDFSQIVAGPFCAMTLAEQGADVIKIEPLTAAGDLARGISAFSKAGYPALFINNNRGKRCVALDLTSAEGTEVALEICRRADVVIENFRPGAMARLGLGYDDVAAVNPEVVYCSISGFGPDGPYADRPVLDPVIQGLIGMVDRQVNPEIPFPDLVRNLIVDKTTAMTAAQGITAALFARDRGAGGQLLEVPMLDAAMYYFWPDGMVDHTLVDDDASSGFMVSSVYQLTECADGKIVYFVVSDPMRLSLFESLGHPEWGEDPRFESMLALSREGNFEALGALIAEAFRQLTVDDALAALMRAEVPCGPILTVEDTLVDPQVLHNELIQRFEHDEAGTVQAVRPPVRFSKTRTEVASWFGARGEHNAEVLQACGFDGDAVEALLASGVIGT